MSLSKTDFLELLNNPLLKWVNYSDGREMIAEDAVWIDVRLPAEYQAKHIKDSVNIPLPLLRVKIEKLDPERRYLIYCDSGRRSSIATYLLSQHGIDAMCSRIHWKMYQLRNGITQSYRYCYRYAYPYKFTGMNSLAQALLIQLADGQFHSGTTLGQRTGRSRTAVWKAVQFLQKNGLQIYSVRGKGYRLAEPVELLNRSIILSGLDELIKGASATSDLQCLDIFHEIESTNAYLLNLAKSSNGKPRACLAEQQHIGRGRRGRRWVSPFGGNIYLSLLWQINAGASQLGGLSLAIAVATMRALRAVGLVSAGVKWPNDILVNGKKLAGILLELSGEASGPCAVVIGVGLNMRSAGAEMAAVDQAWTDLETELGQKVSRNYLAAQLLFQLTNAVREFEMEGLRPFLKEWAACDQFADSEVVLHLPQGEVHGIARGIDESGALLLVTENGVQRYHSGEVSMRALPTAMGGTI